VSATAGAEGLLRAGARAAAAALALLTRVPVAHRVRVDERDLARGAALFPLVGAALGALAGGVAAGAAAAGATPLLAGALGVLAGTLASGALHLDGLADAADALGGRTPADALRIMRDHRLGAYGASALVLDLLVKAAALGGLASDDGWHALVPALLAGALSRTVAAMLAAATPYARAPGSVAAGFTTAARRGPALAAVALALAGAALAGAGGAAQAAAAAAAALLVRRTALRRIGGATGDVLGAAVELAETAALVMAALRAG
jgi:adenosylcobinamide-GDP ribazoletransferase